MKINDILIKISDYDDTINKIFLNKDVVTITEVVNMLENQYLEIEHLREEIEDKENTIRDLENYYVLGRK